MLNLSINGQSRLTDSPPDTPLLWVLREELRLTGTRYGCGLGLCGSCTVHINGQATRSCVMPLAAVGDAPVRTIEGIGTDRVGAAVQAAWVAHDVAQCGYCQSGQVMAATALLQRTPRPTDAQIDEAMAGNLCRCGTYVRIRAAIHAAAASL